MDSLSPKALSQHEMLPDDTTKPHDVQNNLLICLMTEPTAERHHSLSALLLLKSWNVSGTSSRGEVLSSRSAAGGLVTEICPAAPLTQTCNNKNTGTRGPPSRDHGVQEMSPCGSVCIMYVCMYSICISLGGYFLHCVASMQLGVFPVGGRVAIPIQSQNVSWDQPTNSTEQGDTSEVLH